MLATYPVEIRCSSANNRSHFTYRFIRNKPGPLPVDSHVASVAEEGRIKFPLAALILKKQTYVDDSFASADTIGAIREAKTQLIELLDSAKMELGKWISNSPELLTTDSCGDAVTVSVDEVVSTLGIWWLSRADSFFFVTSLPPPGKKCMKRIILSETARLFDPLG